MPPLGNSWQQGRDKPLPPMIPILKDTGFHYTSEHNGINIGRAETGMPESSIGQGRVDDSLGDVGLYSVSLHTIPWLGSLTPLEDENPRTPNLFTHLHIEPILTSLKSSVLMNVFAASARSPGIFKSQPATPATAVFATFQFKEPRDRTPPRPTELPRDTSPRTPHSNGPTPAEPTTFSKLHSSSGARPFSGRTNCSGSAYRE
ncbi:hypothetical protein MMC11_000157 [Xylographa trunciseda]|nr:hypothetical protein [Xylographa trunciseda]